MPRQPHTICRRILDETADSVASGIKKAVEKYKPLRKLRGEMGGPTKNGNILEAQTPKAHAYQFFAAKRRPIAKIIGSEGWLVFRTVIVKKIRAYVRELPDQFLK